MKCVFFGPTGGELVVVYERAIAVWNLATCQESYLLLRSSGSSFFGSAAMSPDGTMLAVGTNQIAVYDISTCDASAGRETPVLLRESSLSERPDVRWLWWSFGAVAAIWCVCWLWHTRSVRLPGANSARSA